MALHTLVSDGRDGISLARIAAACERDPSRSADVAEIEGALLILLDDGLAEREPRGKYEEALYRPTRAAIRARELSF